MVIERLGYMVPRVMQGAFLEADQAIWTAALATQPGYLGKEVWRPADDPDRLELIIRWDNRAAWKAVPARLLAETEARFRAAFPGEAAFLGCTELEVTA
ncbi:MAG: TIGR03792 family protein [Rubellimicrobium sp.]|nr:TIGR03792 family protein [Rubellimicrobium sp.]